MMALETLWRVVLRSPCHDSETQVLLVSKALGSTERDRVLKLAR